MGDAGLGMQAVAMPLPTYSNGRYGCCRGQTVNVGWGFGKRGEACCGWQWTQLQVEARWLLPNMGWALSELDICPPPLHT